MNFYIIALPISKFGTVRSFQYQNTETVSLREPSQVTQMCRLTWQKLCMFGPSRESINDKIEF
jgi:hypothetical protein